VQHKTILAVDDDANMHRLYRRIFSGHAGNHSAHVVSSTQEARKFLSKYPCDGLVLDLGTLHTNSFELLKWVRSQSGLKTLPVIAITDNKNEEAYGVRALKLGADDLITKPFSVALFKAKINRIFKRADDMFSLNASGSLDYERNT